MYGRHASPHSHHDQNLILMRVHKLSGILQTLNSRFTLSVPSSSNSGLIALRSVVTHPFTHEGQAILVTKAVSYSLTMHLRTYHQHPHMPLSPQLHRNPPAAGALCTGAVATGTSQTAPAEAAPVMHYAAPLGSAVANALHNSQAIHSQILDWALLKSAVRLSPHVQAPATAASRAWPHAYRTWSSQVGAGVSPESGPPTLESAGSQAVHMVP